LRREPSDCGANVIVLRVAWIGLFAMVQSRRWLASGLVRLASALKLTPALFIAYLFYRRWFAAAFGALAFSAAFIVSPAFVLGPAPFARHVAFWAANLWRGLVQADPNVGALGVESIGNQALRPALG